MRKQHYRGVLTIGAFAVLLAVALRRAVGGRNDNTQVHAGSRLREFRLHVQSHRSEDLGVGDYHTCALVAPGSASAGWHVKCWGTNGFEQLGNESSDNDCPSRTDPEVTGDCNKTPLDVCATSTATLPCADPGDLLSGVLELALGDFHSCALWEDDPMTTGYGIKCWGDNQRGALGDGRGDPSAQQGVTPVDVCETGVWDPDEKVLEYRLPPPSTANTALTGVESVSSGTDHSCALVGTNDAAMCWGWNKCGQLGTGYIRAIPLGCSNPAQFFPEMVDIEEIPVPVCTVPTSAPEYVRPTADQLNTVAAIEAQFGYSCAVMNTGIARCWGWNKWGELGDGSTTDRAIADQFVCAEAASACDQSEPDDALTDIDSLESGYFQHNCVLMGDDSVKCWGNNHEDQLGALAEEVCGSDPCSTTPLDVIGIHIFTSGDPSHYDADGCTDGQEARQNEAFRGQRNPKYYMGLLRRMDESEFAIYLEERPDREHL